MVFALAGDSAHFRSVGENIRPAGFVFEVGVRIAFDGFFKVVRYRLRHARFAGGMSPALVREVLERGHAVVVLPFDPERDQVVLIEQFRVGALGVVADPWLIEPVAGIIEPDEAAPAVARRETAEEAGLELLDLVPACSYFTSPGGSTETCRVFIGRVERFEWRAGDPLVFSCGHYCLTAALPEEPRADIAPSDFADLML